MKKIIMIALFALMFTGCAEIMPTVVTEFQTDSLVCGVVETEFSDTPAIHCVKK